MRRAAILALVMLLPLTLFADRLTLKDGTTYHGRFLYGNRHRITFQDDGGVQHTFNIDRVRDLHFHRGDEGGASRYRNNYDYGPAPLLPAGLRIQVRTNQDINSANAIEGQTYDATIARDVLDPDGNVIIPRGSDAQLVIRDVSRGGLGSPRLALDLQSVQINGQNYLVSTMDITRSSRTGIGANKRTAEMLGGGATLGTLIGAIAGGGKGAALGALAGAAAGGTVQVLTRGHHVRVPAESLLTFRLDRPLTLQPARGY
jgi:hypothetical protein